MKILAFDTSSDPTAVAVADDDRVLAQDDSPQGDRHGEVLLPRIEAQLRAAGVALSEIDLIGVGLGPGSFTGLRVGVATAKGLALATAIPICGVSSLEVLARGVLDAAELAAVVLDAGRGELYAAVYARAGEHLQLVLAPARATPEATAERVFTALRGRERAQLCGSGVRSYAQVFSGIAPALRGGAMSVAGALGAGVALADPSRDTPRGRHVAQAARALFAARGASDRAALEPIYLRDSDAKLPDEPLAV
jgi:tRNA threonylcarbamoyladenosine biosynthesis protein TsaB